MAVKDFLPLGDVKQAVEKIVQKKPSVAELTTIESPGKPSPASMLENPEEKTKRPRKKKAEKASLEDTKITEPKKDSILIITEKPQAAQKIAQALSSSSRKLTESGVSYYELEKDNRKILVASAVGHLFNLTYKKGQKGWPLFELEWIPSYTIEKSSFTKRYFDLLKKLTRKAQEIIIATDYDLEGEVIGWNVLRFICNQKNAKRMKFSTLTKDELKRAFDSPSLELNWGNAYAGETRHYLDWLYGINLSRALMSAIKKTGSFKILSIGRVQGPALKIIVDREKEIKNFKSEPYWQVFALVKEKDSVYSFKHPKDIFNENALGIFKDIKEAIAETKKTKEKIQPGHPFDLTTLQREAYRIAGISPAETLNISQKLYLDGLISYPRTSSQKIPEAIEPKKILKILEKHFPEAKLASRSKPIEGQKTDPAHPSIYPTGEFSQLSGKEEKLYNLIVKRFIACFSADCITANKKVTLLVLDKKGLPLMYAITDNKDNNQDKIDDNELTDNNISSSVTDNSYKKDNKKKEKPITFTASGLQIIEKGWTSFYPVKINEEDLPDFSGKVKIDEIKIEKNMTQPPNRYTPTSLVSLLEKKNLGTKTTRSMIVETLFARGYLDGRSIQATPLGMKLIESLEKYSPVIIDENLTRQLEEEMEKIQESSSDFEKKELLVLEKAKRLITDISKEFKVHESQIGQDLAKGLEDHRNNEKESNTLMPCPSCKQGNLRILYSKKTRRSFVACSKYPDCRQTFSLPPNALIKKSENNKLCEADNFPKLLAIRKGKRPWEFCFNPLCPIEKAKREEWQTKKTGNQNSSH